MTLTMNLQKLQQKSDINDQNNNAYGNDFQALNLRQKYQVKSL